MPQPVNKTIGHCQCYGRDCDQVADVRRFKNHERGKMYLVCPDCGPIRPTGERFQRWIEENMTTGEPEQIPDDPAPEAETATEPVPEPVPEPDDDDNGGLDEWLM